MQQLDQYSLDQLNSIQRQAVISASAHILVLAGAGSGKTRVLAYRIWWLIRNRIDPLNILAVTFTNKAAAEMRARLEQMLGLNLRQSWIGTFHGLAHRMLRLHWQEADLPQTFQ
ncbi:MAG: UvrD-helicase domain-containing protein, partial [Legionellales bacterium]